MNNRRVSVRDADGQEFQVPIEQVLNGAASTAAHHCGSLLDSVGVRPLVVVLVLEPDGEGIAMAECGQTSGALGHEEWSRLKKAVAEFPQGQQPACERSRIINGKRWACSKLREHDGPCDLVIDEVRR